LPAIRNLRPTEGLCSVMMTERPERAKTSAAINPAGPDPMTRALDMDHLLDGGDVGFVGAEAIGGEGLNSV